MKTFLQKRAEIFENFTSVMIFPDSLPILLCKVKAKIPAQLDQFNDIITLNYLKKLQAKSVMAQIKI